MESADERRPLGSRNGPPQPAVPESMAAVVFERYGGPECLVVRERPVPGCRSSQVLIRVRAAGINPIDWRIRRGQLRWVLPIRRPFTPGFDVAGEVVRVGPRAAEAGWKLGDQVFAFLASMSAGGYAQYVATSPSVVARKPPHLSFAEAAAIPLAGTTALQALRDLGRIAAGQRVLVNGASGGVGAFAVQLARHFGARVTGVCQEGNLDFVRALGAEQVLDYRAVDFWRGEERYDLILDAAAKSSFSKCRQVLAATGCYVTTVPTAGSLLAQAVTSLSRQRCRNVMARPRGADLRFLAQCAAEGALVPFVQQHFPLADAAAAHRVSEQGHTRGKLVLLVD